MTTDTRPLIPFAQEETFNERSRDAMSRQLAAALLKIKHRAAFTLMEILIAIVVLVVGITGIVALFPTAIKTGNQTVVDSYSSIITQSVVDAITVGMRETRYRLESGAGGNTEPWEYFLFDHDGIQDDIEESGIVPENYDSVFRKDFCVLLPNGPAGNNLEANEICLYYPADPAKVDARRTPSYSGGENAALSDEKESARRETVRGGGKMNEIRNTFALGRDPKGAVGSDGFKPIRPEFLGEQVAGAGTSGNERKRVDPYPQYSFSFSMKRAQIDTGGIPGVIDGSDRYSSNLFDVKIKVFRNFQPALATTSDESSDPGSRIPRGNIPLHEFVTLISK
jgi:hypothetical protein